MRMEHLKIIGTAHVSKESIEEVKKVIRDEKPDVVAVELDSVRYNKLMREKLGFKDETHFSIKDVIKGRNFSLFLISSFLTYLQNRVGDKLGVKPGAEMIAAIEAAQEVGANVAFIDRDIRVTMQRVIDSMGFLEKLKFLFTILKSFFEKEEIEDVESLKSDETIDEIMEYLKEASPSTYNVLVNERDAYMTHNLLKIPEDKVVAVVGAGHKKGIKYYLENPEELPSIETLMKIKPSSHWSRLLLLIPLLIIVPFILAFIKGVNIQGDLLKFILFTGGLAFIGSLIAGSKIKSAIVAFIVAPITSIHPLLAAGWFAGLMEAKIRKVDFKDVEKLGKCKNFHELWKNNLFRVLLVVTGANIGCSIGTLLTIPNVILPMISKILGLG